MKKQAKPWKTLSSKKLFEHSHFSILEDIVELPNGSTTSYFRHAPAQTHSVIIIALNAKQEILLQREYSHPPNKVMWQLPGGSMHKGEAIEAAALRELSEESGYSAKTTLVLGHYYIQNRRSDQKQYIVLCTDLYPHKLQEDSDEFIESYWLSKKRVTNLIAHGEIDNINLLASLNIWFYSK